VLQSAGQGTVGELAENTAVARFAAQVRRCTALTRRCTALEKLPHANFLILRELAEVMGVPVV
jgi:hypothetical protein